MLNVLISIMAALISSIIPTRKSVNKTVTLYRHSPFLLPYRGPTKTHVVVSVYSSTPIAPTSRTIYLQKQGWRLGLFGETLARLLGAHWSQGLDVTPNTQCNWRNSNDDAKLREEGLGKRSKRSVMEQTEKVLVSEGHEYRETWVIRIPPVADDGYYKLRLSLSPKSSSVAATTPFRLYSSSLSTPSPRGASLPLRLPLELVFGTGCTAVRAFFLAALPFAKIFSFLPGRWGQKLVNWLWARVGGEGWVKEVKQDPRIQRVSRTVDQADRSLPWSSWGVRRSRDISEADPQRGGVIAHF